MVQQLSKKEVLRAAKAGKLLEPIGHGNGVVVYKGDDPHFHVDRACHGFIKSNGAAAPDVESLVAVVQKPKELKEYRVEGVAKIGFPSVSRYYKFLLEESPWKYVYQSTNVKQAISRGFIVNPHEPSNLVLIAMMSSRTCLERPQFVKVMQELEDREVPSRLAYWAAHWFSFSSNLLPHLCGMNFPSPSLWSETILPVTRMSVEDILAFVNTEDGTPHNNPPYVENSKCTGPVSSALATYCTLRNSNGSLRGSSDIIHDGRVSELINEFRSNVEDTRMLLVNRVGLKIEESRYGEMFDIFADLLLLHYDRWQENSEEMSLEEVGGEVTPYDVFGASPFYAPVIGVERGQEVVLSGSSQAAEVREVRDLDPNEIDFEVLLRGRPVDDNF